MPRKRSTSTARRQTKRRKNTAVAPTKQTWIIAIGLIIVFVCLVQYLDSHSHHKHRAWLTSLFSHSTPSTKKTKTASPDFDFYTDLPTDKSTGFPQKTEIEQQVPEDKPTALTSPVAQKKTPTQPTIQVSEPVKTTVTSTTTLHYLQVASFKTYTDADNLKAKLLLNGFNANTEKVLIGKNEWYRVILGPYHTLEAMNKAETQLKAYHYSALPLKNMP